MAKEKRSLGWLPDDMISGGLASDFDATINEARYVRWDYDGKLNKEILAVRLTMEPHDEEVNGGKPVVQHFSAGDLKQYAPSIDEEEPTEEGEDGYFVIRTGNKQGIPDSSNWSHFMSTLKDCFAAAGKDIKEHLTNDIRSLEGLSGHFVRVPQKQRAGMAESATGDGGEKRQREVLVMSNLISVKGKGAAKGASAGKGVSAGAKSTPAANGAGELDEKIEALVLELLGGADDNTVEKKAVTKAILASKEFSGAEKSKAVKRASDSGFLANSQAFSYNEEEGTLTLA